MPETITTKMRAVLARLGSAVARVWRFAAFCARRFLDDSGPQAAAALSYTSLLALVPLLTVVFVVFSAFGEFEDLAPIVQAWLFEALLPEAARAVGDHITRFVSNASRMTGAGLIGLAATAVLLLNTITGAFSKIWRASEPRPWPLRVLVYWALLTLGPLLLGASISVSSYAFAAIQLSGIEDYTGPLSGVVAPLPFALSVLGFAVLFIVVPNRSVRTHHAVAGAVIAAILFEVLKSGFGFYISHFPSYQAIYGSLAAVPIFLIWMYLSWAVLLLGAEIAAALPEWRAAETRRLAGQGGVQGPGARLALALALLGRLRRASLTGLVLKERALARGLPVTLGELDQVLHGLGQHGFVVRSGLRRWVLSRDLEGVTLDDLLVALGLSFQSGMGWPEAVSRAVESLEAACAEAGRPSLEEILDRTSQEVLKIGRPA